MEPGRTPLLAVRDLTVAADGAPRLVDRLSFDLFAGRTLAVVGESGSGKSLTALALLGLLPAGVRVSAGRALLEGDDLLASPAKARAARGGRIAMIFQEPMTALNPVMTVGDQIAEALRLHTPHRGAALRAEVGAALRGVEIAPDRAADYPHQLSGGMRQRVLIAMALACHPEVLIADEPTTALDASVKASLMALLTRVRQARGLAVMLISHDLGLVSGHADEVCVMYAGRIVERGPTPEVLRQPRHPYTRALLECTPGPHTQGTTLATIGDKVASDGSVVEGRRAWWPGRGEYTGTSPVGPGHEVALGV